MECQPCAAFDQWHLEFRSLILSASGYKIGKPVSLIRLPIRASILITVYANLRLSFVVDTLAFKQAARHMHLGKFQRYLSAQRTAIGRGA